MSRNRVAQKALTLPLDQIHPGRNVRIELTNIESLAESIQLVGLLQPLIVVPVSDDPADGVEVIAGHRRLAACKKAFYDPVEVHVRARGTEEWRLLAQMAENLEREEMSPIEKGRAYRDLSNGGMNNAAIGRAFGVTGGNIAATVRLLDYPDVMQVAVHDRTIGIHDCLAVPLEIARETDGRTLAAKCRTGGRGLRVWARFQIQKAESKGRKIKTTSHTDLMTLAIDGSLGEEVRADAAIRHEKIGEWVAKACRVRLAASRAHTLGDDD